MGLTQLSQISTLRFRSTYVATFDQYILLMTPVTMSVSKTCSLISPLISTTLLMGSQVVLMIPVSGLTSTTSETRKSLKFYSDTYDNTYLSQVGSTTPISRVVSTLLRTFLNFVIFTMFQVFLNALHLQNKKIK